MAALGVEATAAARCAADAASGGFPEYAARSLGGSSG